MISRRLFSTKQPKLLGRYTKTPIDLFRVNSTEKVVLRDYETQKKLGRYSYDLHLVDGKVLPKDGPNFEAPNGASMRPNGAFFQEVVRNFRGKDITIYLVPEGTQLPSNLVLLHEHTDHYSIQTTEPVELEVLNDRITAFLQENGTKMTRPEFCDKYPFTV
jgi:hypothetical protein